MCCQETPQNRTLAVANKKRLFVCTLLSHSEYGSYVRYIGGSLFIPSLDERYEISIGNFLDEELWWAMLSLTHVKVVDLGSVNKFADFTTVPTWRFPRN